MSNLAPYVGATAAARVGGWSGEDAASSPDRNRELEFKEFYMSELASLSRYARALVSDEQAVEDIVAEAMMVVYMRWGHLAEGDGGRLRAYTFGVVRNLARDLYRFRRRHFLVGTSENLSPPAEEPSDSHIGMLDVERTIAQLSEKQSRVLRMEMAGFTTAEIARAMDVGESTARTHLAKARSRMREMLHGVFSDCGT